MTSTIRIPATVTDTDAYLAATLTPVGVGSLRWDEPAGAASPRGWLHNGPMCVGFYLDYGPDHYRSPHASTERVLNEWREVTWCQPGRLCRDCQPGNILAMRYPDGPGTMPRESRESRYVETIGQARAYVKTGRPAA